LFVNFCARFWRVGAWVGSISLLVACGGGGAEGDGTVPLALSSNEVSLQSPGCQAVSDRVWIKVTGGVAPYVIHNPLPSRIGVEPQRVLKAGDSFSVRTVSPGCFTNMNLTVTDQDANTVSLVMVHAAAE